MYGLKPVPFTQDEVIGQVLSAIGLLRRQAAAEELHDKKKGARRAPFFLDNSFSN
jgi:hypothetical protein